MTTKTQTYTVYIAKDGMKFSSMDACVEHEEKLRIAELREKETDELFKHIVFKKICPESFNMYDTDVFICQLNNETDFNIIMDWCSCHNHDTYYMDPPDIFPCLYIFRVDDSGYASSEPMTSLDWMREMIQYIDDFNKDKNAVKN